MTKEKKILAPIPYHQLVYLYQMGKKLQHKVTFENLPDGFHIYICDYDFQAFEPALRCLQYLASQMVIPEGVL